MDEQFYMNHLMQSKVMYKILVTGHVINEIRLGAIRQ